MLYPAPVRVIFIYLLNSCDRYWLLVTGYWLLVTGYWLLVTGYWLLVTGYWLLVTCYWLRSLLSDDYFTNRLFLPISFPTTPYFFAITSAVAFFLLPRTPTFASRNYLYCTAPHLAGAQLPIDGS